jgi:hypothetical protein
VKIPDGWRRVRTSSSFKLGDKMWNDVKRGFRRVDGHFCECDYVTTGEIVIRRVKKAKVAK